MPLWKMHVRLRQFIKADSTRAPSAAWSCVRRNTTLWQLAGDRRVEGERRHNKLWDEKREDNVNWKSECYTPLKCFMCWHTNRSGILNNGHVLWLDKKHPGDKLSPYKRNLMIKHKRKDAKSSIILLPPSYLPRISYFLLLHGERNVYVSLLASAADEINSDIKEINFIAGTEFSRDVNFPFNAPRSGRSGRAKSGTVWALSSGH